MRIAAIILLGLSASIVAAAQQGPSVCERIQQLDGQISTQRATIERLLMRYTEKHPDVMMQRKTLASLEASRAAGTDEAKSKGMSCTLGAKPDAAETAGVKAGAAVK
jgi:hypothetical protein